MTVTPAGISTGSLPILDILLPPLPDVRHDFAANVGKASLFVRHNTLRSGDDRDAETAKDLGELFAIRVHSETGLTDALQTVDNAFARAVLQSNVQV